VLTGRGAKEAAAGPPIDPNLFNQPDDGTQVFIMTPREEANSEEEAERKRGQLLYPRDIQRLRNEIQQIIAPNGPEIRKVVYDYYAANVYPPDQPERGQALFLYDPNANGERHRGWRLLYERFQEQSIWEA